MVYRSLQGLLVHWVMVLRRHETAHEGEASSGKDAQHANASQPAAVQLKLYSRSVRLELFCSQGLWHTLSM